MELANQPLELRQAEMSPLMNVVTAGNGTFNLNFFSLKLTPAYLFKKKTKNNRLKIMRMEKWSTLDGSDKYN